MTRREAVIAAIEHRETGCVPYCFDFTPEAEGKLKAHYGCEDLAERIGNCVRDVPGVWWTFTESPEEVRRRPEPPARLPEIIGRGSYEVMQEAIARLRETTDAFLLVRFYASLFEKAWFWRGMENLLADMILQEEWCEAFFERIVTADLAALEMMLAADVDGVLLGCDWGSQQALLMSPALWRKYIGPRHARMFRKIREAGKYAFLHSCGNIYDVLPDVVKMGVQVLNPAQPECMDIGKLKDECGERLTFWGGVSTQQTLPYGTPEQVRAETRAVAARLGRGGGYILAPAQGVQGDVPVENIVAMIEEAQGLRVGKS
jgi:uroporphyrinogen decarboxylase